MNWTVVAPILGGVGAVFGAYATIQQQRVSNVNKRFEMLFGFQGKTLDDVKKENDDLRVRVRGAERNIMQCEKDKHAQGLKIADLEHQVVELKRMIPNGDSI